MGLSDIGCGDDENIGEICVVFLPHVAESPKQSAGYIRSHSLSVGKLRKDKKTIKASFSPSPLSFLGLIYITQHLCVMLTKLSSSARWFSF